MTFVNTKWILCFNFITTTNATTTTTNATITNAATGNNTTATSTISTTITTTADGLFCSNYNWLAMKGTAKRKTCLWRAVANSIVTFFLVISLLFTVLCFYLFILYLPIHQTSMRVASTSLYWWRRRRQR